MIKAQDFLEACKDHGFRFFTGTPCSYLKPLINSVIDNSGFHFVDAVNEGDAVAMAAGAWLGGLKSVVMFQNSGLGNAVNPLTSLTFPFRIPLLLLITYRAEPGGAPDEPQHRLMGSITPRLLELMQIGWDFFPGDQSQIAETLERSALHMREKQTPYALLVRKNDVQPHELRTSRRASRVPAGTIREDNLDRSPADRFRRIDALKLVQAVAGVDCAVITTTGYTGRELYQLEDRANQLYMVGSMGCALPMSLGLAIAQPELKILVIDGDGALLMRTGTMATVGAFQPPNLIHLLLDNEVHDSTGGQPTASGSISFSAAARGFGYRRVYATDRLDRLEESLRESLHSDGPAFIQFKTQPGTSPSLGRPEVSPAEVKDRFMNYVRLRHGSPIEVLL